MATAGDGRAPYDSGGDGEKFRKRLLRPEINEDPQIVSQVAGQNEGRNLASIFVTVGKSELEQMLKQITFTRSEAERLIALVHSRIMEESPSSKRHKHRDDNFHASIVGSEVSYIIMLIYPGCIFVHIIKLPPFPSNSGVACIRVIGSVDGLICSHYGDDVIHIWNPSLSAVLTLPRPYLMPSSDGDSIYVYLRFGFDPKSNDYKVVKLTGIRGTSVCCIKWWLQVEVFSMRKGLWESITESFPSHITWIYRDYGCLNGPDAHLHWLGCTGEKMDSDTIVAFETFSEIPLPHSLAKSRHTSKLLGVLDGKLCVMEWGGNGACEVWVMEEYGLADSWVKHHAFSQFSGYYIPYGFTSHGDFLINDNDQFVWYNPIANKANIFENLHYEIGDTDRIVEYVDSLVWVTPADRENVDGAGQI